MKFKVYHSKPIDLERIERALYENFMVTIEDAGYLDLPFSAYNKTRNQYNAILLIGIIPSFSIWIVDKDIYVPNMNFIFGLAMNKKAIVSTYRLPEEIIAKEVVHEVGHLFGLNHCKNNCVMQFSNSLIEAIKKPDKLCEECQKKIKGKDWESYFTS